MVHALAEIQRVLKPGGTLIDLRPVEENWPVEVVDSAGWQVSGRLSDLPVALEDDAAAFHAIQEASSRGWFIQKEQRDFPFFYYWDTPAEMKEFMDDEWEGLEKLDDDVYNKTRSLWALANGDARVRIRVKMLLARWQKI